MVPPVARVFDLAQPLYDNCPAFPGDPKVRVKTIRSIDAQ